MARTTQAYGKDSPLESVFPIPVVSNRAPTSSDKNYPLGQVWVNRSAETAYIFTNSASGSATWALAAAGSTDLESLTGDSGTATPSSNNIEIAGGTNITTVASGSTVTANLDDAITVATSVTTPRILGVAASDLLVTSATGQNITVKLGDDAGTNQLEFTDTGDAVRTTIDSDGNIGTVGDIETTEGVVRIFGAGNTLEIQGGAVTDMIGQATLVNGTVSVANTNVTATSRVFITRIDLAASTALGVPSVLISPGSGITINSLQAATPGSLETNDQSVFNYVILTEI